MKKLMIPAMLLLSLSAHADGVDDPNFYQDFDPDKPSKKYEYLIPPEHLAEYRSRQQNEGYLDYWEAEEEYGKHIRNRPTRAVPEPEVLSMIGLGILFLFRRRSK